MDIKNAPLVIKLQKTGFGEKEAKIYVALLELGGAYPSRIAEYSGLNRSTTYKILTDLSIRGLVNEIEKRNKYFYQIEKPEKITRFIESKKKRIEDEFDRTKELIPEIEGLFGMLKKHPKVTYYEGIEGVMSIYEDMLLEKKPYEMLAFSRVDELESFFSKEFFKRWVNTKVQKKITTRGIGPDLKHNREYSGRLFENAPKEFWPDIRYVPENLFPYKGEITLYGESKVSIVNFDRSQLNGIVIEDKNLHRAMRTIFELSWNSTLIRK